MAPASMIRRTLILQIATFARCRRALSTAVDQDAYKAIVVGAGPAGIATVGNLLDRGIKPVLWADERFNGGRLNRSYREVPSNTKVSLFVDFARAVEPFRRIVDGAKGQKSAYSVLEGLDQQKGCQIKYAADLCLQLTDGLRDSEDVRLSSGFVKHASRDHDGNWSVATAQRAAPGTAPLLILCTGSAPNAATLPSQYPNLTSLYLDVALNPPRLAAHLPTDQPLTIALIGASHSAILVLRNLYNLASSSHSNLRIKWFSRHPLRYAEDKGDWILRDNTGLKGETAIWAKENLEPEVWDQSPVRQYVEKVDTSGGNEKERAQYDVHLPDCAQVVEAVGFTRNAVPELVLAGKKMKGEVACDHVTGALMEGGKNIGGLYGVGIAWPEKVVDPAGNTEYAVGLWKFMKYLKRIVPGWVST